MRLLSLLRVVHGIQGLLIFEDWLWRLIIYSIRVGGFVR